MRAQCSVLIKIWHPSRTLWTQETPDGPSRPQKATEGTRRPQKAPEGPRRHQKAPEGPRKHQKAPEATRRPEKIPGPKPQAQGRRPQATGQTTGPECLLCRPAMPQADRGSQVTAGSRSQIADGSRSLIADRGWGVGGSGVAVKYFEATLKYAINITSHRPGTTRDLPRFQKKPKTQKPHS